MKNLIFRFTLILGLVFISQVLYSQEIPINQTFSADTLFNPFTGDEILYSLGITGNINLLSDSSLVRVILIDHYGNHYLVYEAYPMIILSNSFSFNNKCDETCFLDGITPDSLRIDIINAFITIDFLKPGVTPILNIAQLQDQVKWSNDSVKISIINQNITSKGFYWRAGKTKLQSKNFSEKEQYFGRKYNVMGYEFYKGGMFQSSFTKSYSPSSTSYVSEFDWRFRHDANIPNTPYYNSNGTGWITEVKTQPGLTCYAFASIGLAEAYSNLYFNNNAGPNYQTHPEINHQVDLNLSEMEIIRCCVHNPCDQPSTMHSPAILNWMISNDVVDDDCFPVDCILPLPACSSMCTNPSDKIRISGYLTLPDNSENEIKQMLIKYGPISCGVGISGSTMYHQKILIGYSASKDGDTIYQGNGIDDPPIVLDANCPFLGTVNWWFKDSDPGGFSHSNNTSNIMPDKSNCLYGPVVRSLHPTEIKCSDEDGDGYYWWGLHWVSNGSQVVQDNPANCGCPPWVTSDQEDCDDSNPMKGPYTTTYDCQNISTNCVTGNTPIIIDQNYQPKTWTVDQHINQNIIIEANQVLEIKCNVYLSPGAKIIVRPQGVLKLSPRIIGPITYDSKLTSGCGEFWSGIEIHGDPGEDQNLNISGSYAEHQGMVKINHGVIENAMCGIKTFNTGAIPCKGAGGQVTVYDGYASGGIILADHAKFLNNKVDVDLFPYKHGTAPNQSVFSNCSFSTEKPLLESTFPDYHIKFEGTNLITLTACTFSNTLDNLATATYHDRGRGIYSYNSDIRLLEENSTNKCTFSKLEYGIYAMHSGQGITGIKVQNSAFTDCMRGIYISGFSTVNNQEIKNNSFSNIYFCAQSGIDSYGLYLNNSTGFQVENNSFLGNPAFGKPQYGITVNNSMAQPNYIYKNKFYYLNNALTGLNINRGAAALPDFFDPHGVSYALESGLCFVCNDFYDNINDICDVNENTYQNDIGITHFQRSKANPAYPKREPAGNIFSLSHENTTDVYDILFDQTVRPIEYTFHKSSDPSGKRLNPKKVTYEDRITRKEVNVVYDATSCPDDFYTDGSMAELKSRIIEADSKIDSLTTLLKVLVDGGSTDSLREKIETSNPNQTNELYQELMATSPYLSDTVIVTSIANEEVFPNTLIKDIMVANPQSAKSDEILNTLDDRYEPMPDSLYAEIMEGKDTISAREMLENVLSGWIQLRQIAFNALICKYSNDSLTAIHKDSVASALEQDYQLESKFALVMFHLDNMQFAEAEIILNDIPNMYDLSSEQIIRLQKFATLSGIINQLHHDSLGYLSPDSLQIETLQTLAESDMDVPGSYARNILLHSKLITYNESLTGDGAFKSARLTKKKGVKSRFSDQVKIFPIPCKDFFTVMMEKSSENQQVNFRIFDVTGKMVESGINQLNNRSFTIDISNFNPGVYYLFLPFEGKKSRLYKIIHLK